MQRRKSCTYACINCALFSFLNYFFYFLLVYLLFCNSDYFPPFDYLSCIKAFKERQLSQINTDKKLDALMFKWYFGLSNYKDLLVISPSTQYENFLNLWNFSMFVQHIGGSEGMKQPRFSGCGSTVLRL